MVLSYPCSHFIFFGWMHASEQYQQKCTEVPLITDIMLSHTLACSCEKKKLGAHRNMFLFCSFVVHTPVPSMRYACRTSMKYTTVQDGTSAVSPSNVLYCIIVLKYYYIKEICYISGV